MNSNDAKVGAFLGSIFTSIIGEKLGRRKSILIGIVIMIVGALLQATSYTRAHMILGRIVSGFGMGCINSTVPVLQAEFSPKATRGICRFSLCCPIYIRPELRLIRLSRLRTAIDIKLRYLSCVLDRLRLFLRWKKLCMENPCYSSMCFPDPYAFHSLDYSRVSSMACSP